MIIGVNSPVMNVMEKIPWNKDLKTSGKTIKCNHCGKEFYIFPIDIKRNNGFWPMWTIGQNE